ncbi:hypothetical protein HYT26_01535 [Candidatus Pacearchaeota archaeon]|nr:hypothetical protein [Candidatus Pacearchaeota archaeon]
MNYGFHRVVEPEGVVPQAAWKVDNTIRKLHRTEKIVKVKLLKIDSTSMRQMKENYANVNKRILGIVKQRGKMHNPATNSGGVLLGEYNGRIIVPWASLTAIPLSIKKIKRIVGHCIEVEGHAVLFESYPFTIVPSGMDWHVAATALDIASVTIQLKRLVQAKKISKALIIGCGNAGMVAMATIKKYSPKTSILGIDRHGKNFPRIIKAGFTKKLAKIDAVNAAAVFDFAKNCDLVINCVNVPNTEASSVLAAKEGGIVIFFSMATQFAQASLATDATGKDVNLIIASGIAKGEDKEIFQLLKEHPDLFGDLKAPC